MRLICIALACVTVMGCGTDAPVAEPAASRPPTPIAQSVPAAPAPSSAASRPTTAPAPSPAPAGRDTRGSSVAADAEWLRVRQVIDGDTITVAGVGTVRLLGVDAPEKTGGYRESEPFGDEATREMKRLVEGKRVRLEYDGERLDQFKRTLAYVFLEDGTLVNEEIIRRGYAETYRRFTYHRKATFQSAEKEARAAGRGMWVSR